MDYLESLLLITFIITLLTSGKLLYDGYILASLLAMVAACMSIILRHKIRVYSKKTKDEEEYNGEWI